MGKRKVFLLREQNSPRTGLLVARGHIWLRGEHNIPIFGRSAAKKILVSVPKSALTFIVAQTSVPDGRRGAIPEQRGAPPNILFLVRVRQPPREGRRTRTVCHNHFSNPGNSKESTSASRGIGAASIALLERRRALRNKRRSTTAGFGRRMTSLVELLCGHRLHLIGAVSRKSIDKVGSARAGRLAGFSGRGRGAPSCQNHPGAVTPGRAGRCRRR